MVADLHDLGQQESSRLIEAGMVGDEEAIRNAPRSVREFFAACAEPPDWVDIPSFLSGCRMFHRNTRLVLAGMVGGVLVEGLATNIAKSFFLTGRLRDQGVRRLKQNNRHMLEIFMPGGMEKHADGWTHSIRVRLVHAKLRYLLADSDDWDSEELGIPLSAAYLGFAISSFSARLLKHLKSLGGSFDEEEALEIFRIGRICEPPLSMESIVMASSLINSAPLFAGLDDRDERRRLAGYIAQVSHALIGNELADELLYPESPTLEFLWKFRLLNRIEAAKNKLTPKRAKDTSNLTTILDVSMYDEQGISYRLPDHIYAERSSKW